MAAFVFSSHTGARFFCQFPASSRGHDIRTNQQEPTFWLQSATTLQLMAAEPVTATLCQGRFPYNNVWVVGRWQSRSFSLFIFPPFPARNNSTTRSATTTTTVGHRWFDNHLVSVNSLWEFDSYFFKVLFSQKILTDLKLSLSNHQSSTVPSEDPTVWTTTEQIPHFGLVQNFLLLLHGCHLPPPQSGTNV